MIFSTTQNILLPKAPLYYEVMIWLVFHIWASWQTFWSPKWTQFRPKLLCWPRGRLHSLTKRKNLCFLSLLLKTKYFDSLLLKKWDLNISLRIKPECPERTNWDKLFWNWKDWNQFIGGIAGNYFVPGIVEENIPSYRLFSHTTLLFSLGILFSLSGVFFKIDLNILLWWFSFFCEIFCWNILSLSIWIKIDLNP